ncbi:MAG: hypothetical protein E6H05_03075 [Bacillati bacterium ANGP1]|uniref:DUF8173 domain-containing protein n=1 Tax=Candidatus Segetimicrobium genomatis TaxID=2569760 RepID=A0A537IZA1_9BACT|nr:MAG: hypothetical protein E6H05_03075 [Terrabacteria group bacterium ANGP1]
MRVMIGSFAAILLLAQPVRAQGLTVRMSGDVLIPAGTEQNGSVVTMNGRIQVDGTLQGDAMTMNGDIAVAGTVAGSVRTFNGSILLTPTARVDGDVWAVNGRVDRQPGAQVGGRIGEGLVFTRPRAPVFRRPWAGMGRWMSGAFFRMLAGWVMIGFTVMAAAIAALFPEQIHRVSTALSEMPGRALLAGVLLWVLLPPLVMALAVSIVGIPALAFVPLGLSVLGLVGFSAAAMLLGNRIAEGFHWHIGPVPDVVVGAAILMVLGWVPVLGWLAVLLAATWGIGGILLVTFGRAGKAPAASLPSAGA